MSKRVADTLPFPAALYGSMQIQASTFARRDGLTENRFEGNYNKCKWKQTRVVDIVKTHRFRFRRLG